MDYFPEAFNGLSILLFKTLDFVRIHADRNLLRDVYPCTRVFVHLDIYNLQQMIFISHFGVY